MTLNLRYMRLTDIQQVSSIDRESFPTPWSAESYAYEVRGSTYSHMVVLERTVSRPVQGFRRFLRNLSGAEPEETVTELVGYGGLWNIMDEAHISTIAVTPDARGNGYGEVILAAMMRRAITLDASYIILEVRVSNHVAQELYKKYHFEITDRKKNYYTDNGGEDAFDMRLDLNAQTIARFNKAHSVLKKQYPYTDYYTEAQRPIFT